MAGNALTAEEWDAVERLRHESQLDPGLATAAVVMLTRRYARPKVDLAHMLRRYQGLESQDDALATVEALFARGWVEQAHERGLDVLKPTESLSKDLTDMLGAEPVEALKDAESSGLAQSIRFLGGVRHHEAFRTYLRLIESAHREVDLWMLSTSPDIASVPILQERARRGVNVRCLVASPEVMEDLRGGTARGIAESAVKGWSKNAEGLPNFHVRVVEEVNDARLAQSMIVDRNLARIVVYDPHRHRGMEGVLLEFESTPPSTLNITWALQESFDSAWNRARPIGGLSELVWVSRLHWELILALLLLAVGYALWVEEVRFLAESSLGAGVAYLARVLVRWARSRVDALLGD